MKRLVTRTLATVACLLLASAGAVEVPKLKPGLWEMHVSSSAGGVNSGLPATVCVGTMPDAQRVVEEDNIKARCSKYEAKVVGVDLVVDATCTARGNTLTKHSVTSLSGERFHEENKALRGSMTSDGRWLGPCKPGQMPSVFK